MIAAITMVAKTGLLIETRVNHMVRPAFAGVGRRGAFTIAVAPGLRPSAFTVTTGTPRSRPSFT
jgi:hypothetical protein